MTAAACIVPACAAPAIDAAPFCACHWGALARPLQNAVLARVRAAVMHGAPAYPDSELSRLAAACGGEIVNVRPIRSPGERADAQAA